MEKKLTVPRQKKLKKEFPNGEAVGRAFVQFYVEQRKSYKDHNFKTTLTIEEINFLRSTLYMHDDEKIFKSYNVLEQMLRQFTHWFDHFEHIFYHGLFRALAILQIPDRDIQTLNSLNSQAIPDEKAIKDSIEACSQSIKQITDTLIPNWNELMAFAMKKLYSYSLRIEKLQEITKFDFTPLLPDMEHHENEIKRLQDFANTLRETLEDNIYIKDLKDKNDAIKVLSEFIQIDTQFLKPNEEERADDIQKAIDVVELTKRAVQYY
ncbi:MAG: hypothetical protein IJ587_09785 [Synergistaceae bacterium]|nr:hypothetical protein [Synergistaceae bacterium]